MISSIVSIGCIRSLPVLREAFVNDGLRCGIGCLVSIRNVRTRRRQFLPMFTEQIEKPRRRQRIDILDETQIDGDFEKVETGINTLDTEELEQYKRYYYVIYIEAHLGCWPFFQRAHSEQAAIAHARHRHTLQI